MSSTPGLDVDAVLEAVRRWSYIPQNAIRIETDDYQVLRLPDWWDQPLEVRRVTPTRALDSVIDEIIDVCGRFDLPHACWWVSMDAPAGLEPMLRERGARNDETLDVLARALDRLPDLDAPCDLDLRWASDRPTYADALRLGAEVFGGDGDIDEVTLDEELAREGGKPNRGEGGSLVAYLDGRAVGTAGLSLVDTDARLWGGAVVEDARGRGVYRALLAERLRYAVEHGGQLALVKGRVETSGPTLRRAGFEKVGQERSYLLPHAQTRGP